VATAALAARPVAAIGPATAAALSERGITPALVPPQFVAESVVAALAARGALRGARILLPRAEQARDALPDGLRALGAVVDVIPVYRTLAATTDGADLAAQLAAGRVDAVTFTSSSTVQHFVELVGREAAVGSRYAAAVIGPVTAATAREMGLPVAIEAVEYTAPGLVQAMVRHFAGGAP
jgi:uroporphyrinogen III methyltransferase/synthase